MSAPENAATRRSPPEGAKKLLGRSGEFLESAPENAATRRSPPEGAKKLLGRPGEFLESVFWRIADQAELAWRHWDGEYLFHHALSNDTHRLSEAAGTVLLHLLDHGETSQVALADLFGLAPEDLDDLLAALVQLDFVSQR